MTSKPYARPAAETEGSGGYSPVMMGGPAAAKASLQGRPGSGLWRAGRGLNLSMLDINIYR